MSEAAWDAFEHQIYRTLKPFELEGKKCLLMISGGADSMALGSVFHRLQAALKTEIEVLHCHHGPAESAQEFYRHQAEEEARRASQKWGWLFHCVRSSQVLKSEDELRSFRIAQAEKFAKERNCHWIVWGHHQDDFLETQILRLIRGAGPQAVLEPMAVKRERNLRPLLETTRKEIIAYLHNQKIEWLEDPSNQNENYLRNWLRNNWLPQLEEKCPGALKTFSRSLGLMQQSLNETFSEEIWTDQGLSRPLFLTLSDSQKQQIIAQYLRKLGQKEFTHNQIKEIIKHLDIPQLKHTFKSAHLEWTLTKDVIYAKSTFVVNAF